MPVDPISLIEATISDTFIPWMVDSGAGACPHAHIKLIKIANTDTNVTVLLVHKPEPPPLLTMPSQVNYIPIHSILER
jgi:hypothetical protein